MLSFSNVVRRAFSLPKHVKYMSDLNQLRASISTGPQQQHETIYEFRTNCIKPENNAAFLKLTEEKIHLHTAVADLLGYWSVNCGGLNQVLQIWKYGSYAQRADAWSALAQDPEWMEEYIAKAIPMLASQDNEVAYLVPWCSIKKPPKKGVYELATFQMKPGVPQCGGRPFMRPSAFTPTQATPTSWGSSTASSDNSTKFMSCGGLRTRMSGQRFGTRLTRMPEWWQQ
ncbi:hypothetical protein SKAU_G00028970 [Synaphobranchus kaupii]|uniref:NIPSNAP domain-containing protein n=1 Tax=Synaphobranchus kaupii TaxID=118154 RepID=A0A9Q1GEN5_SYNKA|nr:hypothetical protein SKAU_G00028970 [Synaphobranchus kaupii]